MKEKIIYIFRKPDPKYFSIESVFQNISTSVAGILKTDDLQLQFSGGGIKSIWLNLSTFKKQDQSIYHITGDVHYMALVSGKRTVLTIHDIQSALQGNVLKNIYIRLFWFWLPALFVKKITVISHFTQNELSRIIPFAKDKIKVIHNPIHPNFQAVPYAFNSEKPQILFIGTKANKNLERSFEAIRDISCTAVIIGKLTHAQSALLKTFQITYENKVNLTFQEIIACYQNSDFVCFASKYEGFGMPIIEAQAMGKPIITSKVGAMLEVSNDTACMVDPKDVNAIREAVLRIINDKAYREKLIADGFENVKRFQPDYIANQYIELYRELMK